MEEVVIVFTFPDGMEIRSTANVDRERWQATIAALLHATVRYHERLQGTPSVVLEIDGRRLDLKWSRTIAPFDIPEDREMYPQLRGTGRWFVGVRLYFCDIWRSVAGSINRPTIEQQKAVGRYSHSVSVVALSGSVASWYASGGWLKGFTPLVVELFLTAVVLFLLGNVTSKGE